MYADNAANRASLSSLNETAQANTVPAISITLFGGHLLLLFGKLNLSVHHQLPQKHDIQTDT